MSTKFVRVELSEKFLPLSKYGDIILVFYFLFRTNVKKRYLDESDFHHCYGNFFEIAILKVTWSQFYSKFYLCNCEAHWKHHFEKPLKIWRLTVEDFIIKTWVNIIKRKWTKKRCKKNTTPHFKEHCTKVDDDSLIVICFFFFQTNLVLLIYSLHKIL